MPGFAPFSRDALRQLAVLALVALLATLPFWLTDLDLRAAAIFHHPEASDPWPLGQLPPWSWLYAAVPPLTALLLLGALGTLAAGWRWPRFRQERLTALLLLGTLLLGPGLLVNAIFKDHWGRPRPQQIQTFGGTLDYLPPLARGEAGAGRSFPSGHSSVGYALGILFLVWRRRRPRLAWIALGTALLLGSLTGVARMAAGGHFLSDILWSWVMAHGAACLLYYGLAHRVRAPP